MKNKCLLDAGNIMKNKSGSTSKIQEKVTSKPDFNAQSSSEHTEDDSDFAPKQTRSNKKPPKEHAKRSKRRFTWFFNFRAWADWDRSKFIATYFLTIFERFFVLKRKPKASSESFDTAVAKFNLDQKELKAKALGLKRLSYTLVLMAVFLFCYGIYQLCYGSLRGVLISVVETGIALVLAFRYHFWYFQIEHRKLGCSVKEWFKTSFTGGGR